MSQTPHPLDELLEEFNDLYTDLAQTFLRTGNEIDEWERRDLDRLNQKRRKLLAYRHRQVAGQSFERNGDTDLTRRRFNEAGHSLRVVERTGPKIVRIDDYKHAKTAS